MDKDERRQRWQRRKGGKTGRLSKQGFVGGNPRYGKNNNSWQEGTPNKGHRNDQAA